MSTKIGVTDHVQRIEDNQEMTVVQLDGDAAWCTWLSGGKTCRERVLLSSLRRIGTTSQIVIKPEPPEPRW